MQGSQKLFILTYSAAGGSGGAEINEHLGQGWSVVHVSPMGGGGASSDMAAVVVLERSGTSEAVQEALEEELERVVDGDGGQQALKNIELASAEIDSDEGRTRRL